MINIRKLLTTLILLTGLFSTPTFANQDDYIATGNIDNVVYGYEKVNGKDTLIANVVLKIDENTFTNLFFANESLPMGASLNGALGKWAAFFVQPSHLVDNNSNTYLFGKGDLIYIFATDPTKDAKKMQEIKAALLNKHLTA